jgi:hypothetical protein
MNDLEPERSAPYLTVAPQARAARKTFMLGTRKIKESQRQRSGTVAQANQQVPTSPENDLAE